MNVNSKYVSHLDSTKKLIGQYSMSIISAWCLSWDNSGIQTIFYAYTHDTTIPKM